MIYEVPGPWLCECCGAVWVAKEQAQECEGKHEQDPIPLSPIVYLREAKDT
jgi:hypothetical protein